MKPTHTARAEVIDFERWRVATEHARELCEYRRIELARLRTLRDRRAQRLEDLDAQIRRFEAATPKELVKIRRQPGWEIGS